MSGSWHGGKGSSPRKGADRKAYEDGWERIFGRRDSSNVEGDSNGTGTEGVADGGDSDSDVHETER